MVGTAMTVVFSFGDREHESVDTSSQNLLFLGSPLKCDEDHTHLDGDVEPLLCF